MLAQIRSSVKLPVVAIGGIGFHNAGDVVSSGADGIALISAVAGADDIKAAAKRMKEIIVCAKASRRVF